MGFKKWNSLFGFVLIFVSFHASLLRADVFDFNALMAMIKQNHVASIQDFIHFLPPSYQKNPVLMTASHSRQTGTQDHPRVILYGNVDILDSIYPGQNQDHLYIAFQTDTSTQSKLPHTVEVIEWNFDQKSYAFHAIDFKDDRTDPAIPPYAPGDTTSCVGCHGNPGRPNWTAYPDWPGALASNHRLYADVKPHPDYTADDIKKFMDNLKRENPRLEEVDLSDYSNPYDVYLPSDDPDVGMTRKVGDQLILRDIPYLIQTPDFQKLKFAFAGAFLKCQNFADFFPADYLRSLQTAELAKMQTDPLPPGSLPASPASLSFSLMRTLTTPYIESTDHFGGYDEEISVATWLRFLFEGRGMSPYLKNILGSPPVLPQDPRWNYDFAGMTGRLADGLSYEFFHEMKHDSDIGDLDLFSHQTQNGFASATDQCHTFAQRSVTALRSN